MRFFDKVLRTMPGSPRSVAKNLLHYYLNTSAKFPNVNSKAIFRMLLRDRYAVIKTMDAHDINKVLSSADTLVELTISVVAYENPAAFSPQFERETTADIVSFFQENAPLEFEKFVNKVKAVQKSDRYDRGVIMNDASADPSSEVIECYNGFYSDISGPLEECIDNYERATRIGSEIPIVAQYDFENFNTLLLNNGLPEIKAATFMEEQLTFYILFSDRYVFSELGSENRDEIMEAMEEGYLDHLVKLVNNDQAVRHHYRNILIEREKEAAPYESTTHLLMFHKKKLTQKLGLERGLTLVKSLLNQIVDTGATMFAINMLSTFEEDI